MVKDEKDHRSDAKASKKHRSESKEDRHGQKGKKASPSLSPASRSPKASARSPTASPSLATPKNVYKSSSSTTAGKRLRSPSVMLVKAGKELFGDKKGSPSKDNIGPSKASSKEKGPEAINPMAAFSSKKERPKLSVSPFKREKDIKEERLYLFFNTYFISLVAVIALISVLSVAVLLMLRGSTIMPMVQSEKFHSVSACKSLACLEAEALLNSVGDFTVDPCADLHQHVCGRWMNIKGQGGRLRGRYFPETLRNFSSRVHLRLTSMLATDATALEHNMMTFYYSCYSLMTTERKLRDSVDSAVNALQIDVIRWVKARDFPDLFPLLVETNFKTGLPSVLNVTYEEGTIYVDVGTSLSSILRPAGVGSLYFSRTVTDTLQIWRKAREGKFRDLDAKVDKVLSRFVRTPFVNKTIKDLSSTGLSSATWLSVIKQSIPPATNTINSGSRILMRGTSELRGLLSLFKDAYIEEVVTYIISLYLAHVLQYEFYKTFALKGKTETDKIIFCLELTARYSRGLYVQWLATMFQHQGAVFQVTTMYQNLRESFYSFLLSLTTMDEGTKTIMLDTVRNTPHVFYDSGASSAGASVGAPANESKYTSDFMSNLVKASRVENRDNDDRYPSYLWQSTGALGYIPSYKVIVTSTPYMSPDAFYLDAEEVEVNLATLGATIAEGLVDAALSTDTNGTWQELFVGDILGCYKEEFVTLREWTVEVHSAEARKLASMVKGVVLAFQLSRSLSPQQSSRRAQLFFRRSCLKFCGDNTTATVASQMACNFVAATMREFVEAFNCTRKEYVQCE